MIGDHVSRYKLGVCAVLAIGRLGVLPRVNDVPVGKGSRTCRRTMSTHGISGNVTGREGPRRDPPHHPSSQTGDW